MTDERALRAADEMEIRDVVTRLALLADEGNLEDYMALYTEDAHWEAAGHPPRRGHAEILAGARERRAAGTQGPGTHTRHVVVNISVRVDGDTARANAYYLFYGDADTAPVLRSMGVYDDTFRRTPAGWKLARRVARPG